MVYPKRTNLPLGNTWSKLTSKFKGWFFKKKPSSDTKDEEEFDLPGMNIFCLQAYLEKYKEIFFEGSEADFNIDIFKVCDDVSHVYRCLSSFWVCTQGSFRRSLLIHLSECREVCGKITFSGIEINHQLIH